MGRVGTELCFLVLVRSDRMSVFGKIFDRNVATGKGECGDES